MRISCSGDGRWRRSILGNLRTEVLMSSIRISISEGGGSILGNLRAKVPKGGGIFCQDYHILCDFLNKIFTLDPALASHTLCVWRLINSILLWENQQKQLLGANLRYIHCSLQESKRTQKLNIYGSTENIYSM